MIIQPDMFRTPGRPPVMAAYGVGVDSTAMLIDMVENGEPIDMVLTAHTGSEKRQFYPYLAMFKGWLAERGVPLEEVTYQPKNFKHWPPYRSLLENCLTNGTLPSISFGFSSCSQKWKVEPQNRWTERWEPAVAAWAAGQKVIKLIGYDCSPADAKRYAHAEGYQDDRYQYEYPLRKRGWARPQCIERIERAGLPIPQKSACLMCAAMKPEEVDELEPAELRLIVLIEARAAPRLRTVDGLWRKPVKGMRGATPRPGSMTEYIRDKGLLPNAEIADIIEMCPRALVAFQEAQSHFPIGARAELSQWVNLFIARDAGMFTDLYATTPTPSGDEA